MCEQAGAEADSANVASCRSGPHAAASPGRAMSQGEIARLCTGIAHGASDRARSQSVLSHQKQTFVRALTLARIGVWECTLPENRLEWSDGVYDIFGLPRGACLERSVIAGHYKPDSLIELERLRSRC